jgi:hypothetical protein
VWKLIHFQLAIVEDQLTSLCLPEGAGYGHAHTAPQFPVGGNGPATFVPTPGGVAPGPQVPGGAPGDPPPDPLQALAATLQANLAQSIQPGIQQYMQAQGGPAPPPVPIPPEAHYGASPGMAPPAVPAPPPGLGPMMGGIPAPAFAPPPAYHAQMPPPHAAPYAGAPVPAPPAFGGPIPRTGFDFNRLQMPGAQVPPGPRQSTFPAPFVPVQPPKPLFIDDFLTVNAVHALKSAPNRLLFDHRFHLIPAGYDRRFCQKD